MMIVTTKQDMFWDQMNVVLEAFFHIAVKAIGKVPGLTLKKNMTCKYQWMIPGKTVQIMTRKIINHYLNMEVY